MARRRPRLRTARLCGGLVLLAALGAALAACNTVEGVGRDLEAVGSAIERAAKDVKD